MDIFKIIGVAFITAVTSILLKNTKPELSFAVTMAGVIVILLCVINLMKGSLLAFSSLAQMTGMENGLIKILLKIVGIGYITEFGAGILQDFGCASLSNKVILAGKVTVIILALPILEQLLGLIKEFLQLV